MVVAAKTPVMPRPSRHGAPKQPMQAHAADAAALLRLLANEQRLLILCHLVPGELAVAELGQRIALSQSALSQHLALLREAGLVTSRREGLQVFYAVAAGPACTVLATLHAIYCPDSP